LSLKKANESFFKKKLEKKKKKKKKKRNWKKSNLGEMSKDKTERADTEHALSHLSPKDLQMLFHN
jgi:hypothetical protein